jgi:hypothetical protein
VTAPDTKQFALPDLDAATGSEWVAALEQAVTNYRNARTAHTAKVIEKARLVRSQKALKAEIVKELRAGGMAVTPANKEYVNDPRWEEQLDKTETLDIEITDLDNERSAAAHEMEATMSAFERATVERKISAPLVIQPDGSRFQMGNGDMQNIATSLERIAMATERYNANRS